MLHEIWPAPLHLKKVSNICMDSILFLRRITVRQFLFMLCRLLIICKRALRICTVCKYFNSVESDLVKNLPQDLLNFFISLHHENWTITFLPQGKCDWTPTDLPLLRRHPPPRTHPSRLSGRTEEQRFSYEHWIWPRGCSKGPPWKTTSAIWAKTN